MNLTAMTLIAALAAATTAHAEPAHMRVHLGDLDLKTEAGAQQALVRIGAAAKVFCTIPLALPPDSGFHRCQRSMAALAVKQLDAPLVTALANPPQAVQLAEH